MKVTQHVRAGYLVTLAMGAAIGLTIIGPATAGTRPATVTGHHFSIAASAFAPQSLGPVAAGEDYLNQWDPATLSNNGQRCFNAGLVLPNGAKLSSATFFYTQGAHNGISMEISRQDLGAHTAKFLAGLVGDPTGQTTVYKQETIGLTTVVNTAKFAYTAGVCPMGDSTFTGLTISYTGG